MLLHVKNRPRESFQIVTQFLLHFISGRVNCLVLRFFFFFFGNKRTLDTLSYAPSSNKSNLISTQVKFNSIVNFREIDQSTDQFHIQFASFFY